MLTYLGIEKLGASPIATSVGASKVNALFKRYKNIIEYRKALSSQISEGSFKNVTGRTPAISSLAKPYKLG